MTALDDPWYVAQSHECGACGDHSRLAVRWNGKGDECWCPACGATDGFRWRETTTAQWFRAPESIPVQIANRLAEKYHDEIEALAEGLPPELAEVVRQKYFGLPIKKEERHANQGTD